MTPRLTELYTLKEGVTRVSDLVEWLKESVPVFVWKFMIDCHAVRVCGTVSHAWAAETNKRGIPTSVIAVPGHFKNVVETDEGWIEVDLTDIQFEMNSLADRIADEEYDERDPFGESRAVRQLIAQIIKDPGNAISVKKIAGPPRHVLEPDNSNFDYQSICKRAEQFFGGRLPEIKIEIVQGK